MYVSTVTLRSLNLTTVTFFETKNYTQNFFIKNTELQIPYKITNPTPLHPYTPTPLHPKLGILSWHIGYSKLNQTITHTLI
ncbi:MAG: hypothetical protein ACRAVC_24650 [Trichormus sp.]